MDFIISLAIVMGIGGGVGIPAAIALSTAYREERLRIEAGEEPEYPYLPSPLPEEFEEAENHPKQKLLPPIITQAVGVTKEKISGVSTTDFDDLIAYPSILIYGAQGSGKTSFAAWLLHQRLKAGHQLKILDPHRKYGQWKGLQCVGDGMDYEAINQYLEWFTEEIKSRYLMRSQKPDYDPPKLTILCDEFTSWSDKCPNSSTFFKECLSDIRKINLHVLFVSHARTLLGLGGAKGLAATRDAGLLEIELEATINPVTKEASPKLQGWLKYPGQMENRERIYLTPEMNGSMDFSEREVNDLKVNETPVVEPETEPITTIGEPLDTILTFISELGHPVTVREVQRKDFAVLRGKSSSQIRQYLGLLEDMGYVLAQESESGVRFGVR